VEEGILPGGGVALLRSIEAVSEVKGKGDEKIGIAIVAKALESPIRQIATNCGTDGAVVADEVRQKGKNIGYDANTGEYVDMLKAGIIDPVKVVKNALLNASSIAGLMLTTSVCVTRTDEPGGDKKPKVEGAIK
jgi:chaperonin GroEL